jgi:hypothetical protein
MFANILSALAVKLLAEKVIIKLTLSCVGYLVNKTDNTLDNELYETIKGALK